MPSAAHRREWEYLNNDDDEPVEMGSVQPRARFGPTAIDGAAETKPDRRGPWLVLLAVLGGLALLLLPSTDEILVRLRGEGYVHWHSVRWQAVQAAVTHQKPLVVLRYHSSQADTKRRLAREVLAHASIQRLADGCIWLLEEDGTIGVTPTLTVRYLDDATVLAGPWKVSEVTAPQLELDLKEALAENQRLCDETTRGS